jgi:hypothetical protein
MTNNATGIDIRKALRIAGLNPNEFDEKAIYEECELHSISDWELEGQILPDIERFRK